MPLQECGLVSGDSNSNRTEEYTKMAERADDLGIPIKLRPASGVKVQAAPVADPPRFAAAAVQPAEPTGPPAERSGAPRGNEVDRRTLILGQGMSLAGEITSCDRLIVEGSIQATLEKCQHVIIAESGVFNGHASTENADVRGRFEGDLTVRKRLLIRAGGHVSGTVTYGEIEIESGGGISGTIEKAGANNADLISLSA
jgi:cytoskeletal protein CcmA (bactofilin family)